MGTSYTFLNDILTLVIKLVNWIEIKIILFKYYIKKISTVLKSQIL